MVFANGVGTVNSDWATGGVSYYKIGRQCVINAQITLKTNTTIDNTLLFSGLPAAAYNGAYLIHGTTGYGVFKTTPGSGNITIDSGATGNSNLADAIIKSTYKTALRSPDKTHTLGIHDNGTAYLDNDKVITNADFARESADLNTAFNGIGAISMYNWSNTTLHTPHKEGITVYGNGFAIGFDIGNFKVQVAFAVGENRIFIRSLRDGGSFSTWVAK